MGWIQTVHGTGCKGNGQNKEFLNDSANNYENGLRLIYLLISYFNLIIKNWN